MDYRLHHLNNAIDNQKYEWLKKILTTSRKYLINNGCSDGNTLIRSIKSVLSNKNLDQFNPGIIELLFEHGAQCIKISKIYNTLNTVITWSGRYIDMFQDDEKKLIAEQNAINIIDIVIKNGAKPFDVHPYANAHTHQANTLSIAMKVANLNILKFLIDAKLKLKPSNYSLDLMDHPIDHPEDCNTFNFALNA
jgi:hypothetical protein